MNPAYSVILFTTASGAGYGLLAWLAAATLHGSLAPAGGIAKAALLLALALVTVGLLSSTAHLGRPERAWRALSQWRTSWLSREGVLAIATYVPAGLWLLVQWLAPGAPWGVQVALAVGAAVGALATVWATGMIYRSLPTIRAWADPIVPPIYMVLALATGGVALSLLRAIGDGPASAAALATSVLLLVAAVAKWLYWQRADRAPKTWTVEAATGLGGLGRVRPLDPPHTQANYIMREMGYAVARKHARKLRGAVLAIGLVAPAILMALSTLAPPPLAVAAVTVAALGAGLGVVVERWLFFAEARHVSALYYGLERA